ncbi:MAG: HD domain-containing protein [Patescibacteria group bacterium]
MTSHPISPPDADSLRSRLFAQDPRLLEAAKRLANAVNATDDTSGAAQPRALIVGGFVRDAIFGGHPKDLDVEVFGVPPARLEELLNGLYPGLVNTVGRSFGILKVHLADDIEFDVSIPRRESKSGTGHRGFAIEGDPTMSVEDAARRRDFTVDAIYADPLTGDIIDPFKGLQDLTDGVLRIVDATQFADDPLRVYRAIQLAARLNLTTGSQTLDLLRQMVKRGDLEQLAKERVTDELKKLLLKSEKPSIGFALARELGIVERYWPELRVLESTNQEPEWHPEGNVWIHTLMVTDQAAKIIRQPERGFSEEEKLEVMLGALCHDLGKASTTKIEEGRIRSRGHEAAGVEAARSFLSHFTFGETIGHAAEEVAGEHLKPVMLYKSREAGQMTDAQYTNAVRKLVTRIYPTSWRVLLASAEADMRGRGIPGADTIPYAPGPAFIKAVEQLDLAHEAPKTLLQGRDLLALGVPAGPRIGELIQHVEDLRDEGTITTKQEALSEIEKQLTKS